MKPLIQKHEQDNMRKISFLVYDEIFLILVINPSMNKKVLRFPFGAILCRSQSGAMAQDGDK